MHMANRILYIWWYALYFAMFASSIATVYTWFLPSRVYILNAKYDMQIFYNNFACRSSCYSFLWWHSIWLYDDTNLFCALLV